MSWGTGWVGFKFLIQPVLGIAYHAEIVRRVEVSGGVLQHCTARIHFCLRIVIHCLPIFLKTTAGSLPKNLSGQDYF